MEARTYLAILATTIACTAAAAVHAQTSGGTSPGVVPSPPTTTPAPPMPQALPPGVTGIPPVGTPPRGLPPNPEDRFRVPPSPNRTRATPPNAEDRFRVPPEPGITGGEASPGVFPTPPPVSVPSIGQTNPAQPRTVPSQ